VKFNAGVTLAILAVMTLLGAAYMAVGVLDMSPTKQSPDSPCCSTLPVA